MHYKIIGWDVDSDDWKAHVDPAEAIKQQMSWKRSGIVLMHDTYQRTADRLQAVIDFFRWQGKTFLTVDKCVHISKPYRSSGCNRQH